MAGPAGAHRGGNAHLLSEIEIAVVEDRRGRGLGGLERGENDHMWAINEALGYETAGVCGVWQKKLA